MRDPKAVAWDRLCQSELAGTVEKFVGRSRKDVVIRSKLRLVHPEVDEPFDELYGGTPQRPDQAFKVGDRVVFKLDRNWKGTAGRVHARPDPVKVETIRRLKDGEVISEPTDWQQILDAVAEVDRLSAQIRRSQEELAKIRAEADGVVVEAKKARSEADAYVKAEHGKVQLKWDQLNQQRQALDRDREEFEARGGTRFIQAFLADQDEQPRESRAVGRPDDVVKSLRERAEARGLTVEDWLIRRVLVGHLIAALTGQILIYGGPPGSGKTTMANWMPRVLDMHGDVFPVRPGWLDAADLLGFYDPRQEQFVPTPFLDFVWNAGWRDVAGGVMHVAVLDEMNIAHVENYGADLLSRMEKAHEEGGDGQLTLYSPSLFRKRDRSTEHAAEGSGLQPHRIPPRIQIPRSLILAGTLNNDETTQSLSPKVLDRALGVRVPVVPPSLLHRGESSSDDPVFSLDRHFVDAVQRCVGESTAEVERHWSALVQLLDGPRIPSVHVSHRTLDVVRLVPAISKKLGLAEADVLDDVVCLKVLPKIRFFSDDKDSRTATEELRDRAHSGRLPRAREEIDEVLDESDELVQYLR
jgi:hypothetical protein